MIDKLEWNAIELMEYIGIIESIYLPDLEEYKYNLNVERCEATEEQIEELRNIPFSATSCMVIFRNRYNEGLLSKQHLYDKYRKEDTVQYLLLHLELDADKFWLLLLFIFDYCESMFYQGITMRYNPLEQLQQLVTMIDKSASGTLNFKAGKSKVEIDDTRAIQFIANAIERCVNEADIETIKYLSRRVEAEEMKEIKDSPIIAYFAKMMLTFFNTQSQIREKRKEGASHSVKELDLVGQLIYFTRLSTNKSWIDIESKTLKPLLKQYKDYSYPHNISNIYPEFSV